MKLSECRSTQPHCPFEHRVEHRREVTRRGVDDLQYLSGRRLLIERLAGLVNQPRVLHRDDRLRREALHQCNLFVGKWANFGTENREVTDENAVLAQRYGEMGSCPSKLDSGAAHWIASTIGVVYQHVRDVRICLPAGHSTQAGGR